MSNTREKGNIGEDIACKYLQNKGFTVIRRNYLKRWGELDIVAVKDDALHFFEVKSVTLSYEDVAHNKGHTPEENVHSYKIHHLRKIIETFLAEYTCAWQGRDIAFEVHVLCVYMNLHTRKARIKWIKNVIL